MTILEHVDAEPWERAAFLKRATAERKAASAEDGEEDIALTNEEVSEERDLSEERYEFLKAHEQFVLTVTEYGYGKRSSSYDFRVIGRGGKGIRATDLSKVRFNSTTPSARPLGPTTSCHGRPIRSAVANFAPGRASVSSRSGSIPAAESAS